MFELQQRLSNKDPMPIRCNLYDFNQNLFWNSANIAFQCKAGSSVASNTWIIPGYLEKCWTQRLDSSYCQIFKIRNTDLQLLCPGNGNQKKTKTEEHRPLQSVLSFIKNVPTYLKNSLFSDAVTIEIIY